jgi:hypothetical protein
MIPKTQPRSRLDKRTGGAIRATIARLKGDLTATIAFFSCQALEYLPQEEAFWRASTALNLGAIYFLGNDIALGEIFHITSGEILTWNQIFEMVAQAASTEINIVHIPSDLIASFDPEWGASLLGDKAHV